VSPELIRKKNTKNPLPFHKFDQKLANSDILQNCTASLQQLTALLIPLVPLGVSKNKFSPNPDPAAFQFLPDLK